MHIFVRHIFGIQSDSFLTRRTIMSKVLFIAWNATGMIVRQDILVSRQAFIARNANKMLRMEIFSQCLKMERVIMNIILKVNRNFIFRSIKNMDVTLFESKSKLIDVKSVQSISTLFENKSERLGLK